MTYVVSTSRRKSATIIWDKFGIPHIRGETIDDVLYGYAFAHMRNHAEAILKKVAMARGKLANYFGTTANEEYLIHCDLAMHTREVPMIAKSWADEELKHTTYLSSFCDGINDWIKRHREELDETLLRVFDDSEDGKQGIKPADIIGIFIFFMHYTWMESIQANITSEVIRKWERGEPIHSLELNPRGIGSNAWAFGRSKVAGHETTILVSNPHLPWANQDVDHSVDPDICAFFEAQLLVEKGPNGPLTASGVTLTGLPFIMIGFSKDLGWTHTNNTLKNVDAYEIKLDAPLDITKLITYHLDNKQCTIQSREIQIKKRDGSYKTFNGFKSMEHGPIIAVSTNDGGRRMLAIRRAGIEGDSGKGAPLIAREYWARILAKNLTQFRDAIEPLQMPHFNTIYADSENIMYFFGGRQPRRNGGKYTDYLKILDGNKSSSIWKETWRAEELPIKINPKSGFVQNANDPPWFATGPSDRIQPEEFPEYLSPVELKFRAQNSLELLSDPERERAVVDGRVTVDVARRIKNDTRAVFAARILPALLGWIAAYDKSLIEGARVLSDWHVNDKLSLDESARGGLLFEVWYECFMVGLPEHDPLFGPEYPKFLKQWTWDQPLSTPKGLRDEDKGRALDALHTAIGWFEQAGIPLSAQWGDIHETYLETRDSSLTNWSLVERPISGKQRESGGRNVFGSLRLVEAHPQPDNPLGPRKSWNGDSYVNIVEFGADGPINPKGLLVYGNASRPGSLHISDQLDFYRRKELRDIYWTEDQVNKNMRENGYIRNAEVMGCILRSGELLRDGDVLVSQNREWCVCLHPNGDLCLYHSDFPHKSTNKWCASSAGLKPKSSLGPKCAYLQDDGNLCV